MQKLFWPMAIYEKESTPIERWICGSLLMKKKRLRAFSISKFDLLVKYFHINALLLIEKLIHPYAPGQLTPLDLR